MMFRKLLVAAMTVGLLVIFGCGDSSTGSGDQSLCEGCPTDAIRIACQNAINTCDILPLQLARDTCYINATQQFNNQGCN